VIDLAPKDNSRIERKSLCCIYVVVVEVIILRFSYSNLSLVIKTIESIIFLTKYRTYFIGLRMQCRKENKLDTMIIFEQI
jgi:hypothetical protein